MSYTPTTKDVKAAYCMSEFFDCPDDCADCEGFEHWLHNFSLNVAEYGWDMAIKSLVNEDGTPLEVLENDNPYRRAKSESR